MDHRGRFVAPHSLAFNSSSTQLVLYLLVNTQKWVIFVYLLDYNVGSHDKTEGRLYCGLDSAIEGFDISSPEYDTSDRLQTSSTKQESFDQNGIISALAFAPDQSGCYTAGAYGRTLSTYDENVSTAVKYLDGVSGGGISGLTSVPTSGVPMSWPEMTWGLCAYTISPREGVTSLCLSRSWLKVRHSVVSTRDADNTRSCRVPNSTRSGHSC